MTSHGAQPTCYTDFALEEYIQGRLDPAARADLENHAAVCSECGRALESLKADAALLRRALLVPAGPSASVPPDQHLLAAYLDNALNPAEAAEFETLLAADPALLSLLVHLSRDVEAAASHPGTGEPVWVSEVPAGQLLRMPTRNALPARIAPEGLKFGDGRPA